MIDRELAERLKLAASQYPILAILGARQVGKTTLARMLFPNKPYRSLENPDNRRHALQDPNDFLASLPEGAIIDEAQHAPELFSYLQTRVDEQKEHGLFILTGSQNFLMLERVTQSLAGRVAIRNLYPFSYSEITTISEHHASIEEHLFRGGYPRIYQDRIAPIDWFADYVQTYLDRDVRQIKNVGDLSSFERFLRMCASRTGQIVNLSSLADDCGIRHNTAKAWISVLEASYLVYQLEPHHENFGKRIRKSPKLYFTDTGLACYLLGITHAEQLRTHAARGSLFENWVINALRTRNNNAGHHAMLRFWNAHQQHEIDCLIDRTGTLTPVEIKSGTTVSPDYFKQVAAWNRMTGNTHDNAYIVYAGDESHQRSEAFVCSWRELQRIPLVD